MWNLIHFLSKKSNQTAGAMYWMMPVIVMKLRMQWAQTQQGNPSLWMHSEITLVKFVSDTSACSKSNVPTWVFGYRDQSSVMSSSSTSRHGRTMACLREPAPSSASAAKCAPMTRVIQDSCWSTAGEQPHSQTVHHRSVHEAHLLVVITCWR